MSVHANPYADLQAEQLRRAYAQARASTTSTTFVWGEPRSLEEQLMSQLKMAALHMACAEKLAAQIAEEKS